MILKHNLVKGLLVVMCLAATSVVQAQTVKFSQNEMTLKALFAAIEAQSSMSVDYDASVININTIVHPVDINGDITIFYHNFTFLKSFCSFTIIK